MDTWNIFVVTIARWPRNAFLDVFVFEGWKTIVEVDSLYSVYSNSGEFRYVRYNSHFSKPHHGGLVGAPKSWINQPNTSGFLWFSGILELRGGSWGLSLGPEIQAVFC